MFQLYNLHANMVHIQLFFKREKFEENQSLKEAI
jgi:hypothetical protein